MRSEKDILDKLASNNRSRLKAYFDIVVRGFINLKLQEFRDDAVFEQDLMLPRRLSARSGDSKAGGGDKGKDKKSVSSEEFNLDDEEQDEVHHDLKVSAKVSQKNVNVQSGGFRNY